MESDIKGQAQREMILQAVHEKFKRYGIRRVTVNEICQGLRISKKTIYQHFSSKEEMVSATTQNILDTVTEKLEEALVKEKSVVERLLGIWQALATLPTLISPEFLADMKADYPHIWEEFDNVRHAMIARFEDLIREGIAKGEIQSEIHPRVFARFLLAIIDHVATPDVLSLYEFTPAEVIQTLITLFTNGLFTDRSMINGRQP